MLQQSQVVHYLLSLGLVNPREVIEEDLTVTDVSRRNSVFLVTTSRAQTLVIKQGGTTLAQEAAVLRALGREPRLAGFAPELVHCDEASSRLVLRSPAGTIPWGSLRRPPRRVAGALGQALASLHGIRPDVPALPGDRLWGLSLPEPPHEQLRDFSAGALDVLSRLQGSRELCERLRRLRAETEDDAFVHGDLRWDNCMQVGPSRVLLIDWELAGRGDGAADLGAALSEYLRLWAGSVPLVDPADPGRLEAQARHPLERLQPAMRALWAGYRRGRAVSLRRVAEHAGVRLLQTAMEYAQGLVTATAEVVTLLQLADNVLRSPDHAAWALMGLRE